MKHIKCFVLVLALSVALLFPGQSLKAANDNDQKGMTFILSAEGGFEFVHQYKGVLNTDMTLSLGHSYGNGLFFGGGIGLYASWKNDVSFPLFVQVRYSFPTTRKVSPFVDLKMGPAYSDSFRNVALFYSSAIGIDTRRLSYYLSYRSIECKNGIPFKGLQLGISFLF